MPPVRATRRRMQSESKDFSCWNQPEEYIQLFAVAEVPSGMLCRKTHEPCFRSARRARVAALELLGSHRVSVRLPQCTIRRCKMFNPWLSLPLQAVRFGWDAQSMMMEQMMRLTGMRSAEQKRPSAPAADMTAAA